MIGMANLGSRLFSGLVSGGLLLVGISFGTSAGALAGESAAASNEDPCYGIAIEIQTEIEKIHKSGNRGAKALAAEIRKLHRLATVPPVTLVNKRPSEAPTVVFQRPTDYSCALAITKAVRKHSAHAIIPQSAARADRINVGMISVWWPADSATVIADMSAK
jgi:hypothetical protein